jgi:hypothetical protein
MGVVHCQEERSKAREVGGKPVQPVQHGKEIVLRWRIGEPTQDEWLYGCGRAEEQRFTLVYIRTS